MKNGSRCLVVEGIFAGGSGWQLGMLVPDRALAAQTRLAFDAVLRTANGGLPVEVLLPKHVHVALDSENAARFLSGMRRRGPWPDADAVAVYGDSPRALLGTAHVKAGELIPVRLLSPVEISQNLAQQVEKSFEQLAESEL